jgi:putative transposase
MPRPPRDFAPGIHHIGAGASGPSPYFRDEIDNMSWIRLFVRTAKRHDWTCIAVCQLSTHWHAIVDVGDFSLPEGMQYLNGEYSRVFNDRHTRVGYLVRDRYWSRRKQTESELINAYCYLANNPVAAGIVARAEDWAWSSHATTIGLSDAFSFVDARAVVTHFGSNRAAARDALRRYVAGRAPTRPEQ